METLKDKGNRNEENEDVNENEEKSGEAVLFGEQGKVKR